MKDKEPNWIDWPNQDFQLCLEDLFVMGARCDAWREFLKSDTLKRLHRVKGHVGWFNRHCAFDQMYLEFDCKETTLRRTLDALIRSEFRTEPYTFQHWDIYDARAWATIPLNWFVPCDNREIPNLQIGIRLPRTVFRDNFTLTHRRKGAARFAQMTFADQFTDRRFNGRRWVAEKLFPLETKRKQMEAELFRSVVEECAKHQVTIL